MGLPELSTYTPLLSGGPSRHARRQALPLYSRVQFDIASASASYYDDDVDDLAVPDIKDLDDVPRPPAEAEDLGEDFVRIRLPVAEQRDGLEEATPSIQIPNSSDNNMASASSSYFDGNVDDRAGPDINDLVDVPRPNVAANNTGDSFVGIRMPVIEQHVALEDLTPSIQIPDPPGPEESADVTQGIQIPSGEPEASAGKKRSRSPSPPRKESYQKRKRRIQRQKRVQLEGHGALRKPGTMVHIVGSEQVGGNSAATGGLSSPAPQSGYFLDDKQYGGPKKKQTLAGLVGLGFEVIHWDGMYETSTFLARRGS